MLTGGTLFEELGFYYVGPVDGHDLDYDGAYPAECAGCQATRSGAGSCCDGKGQGPSVSKPDKENYHAISGFDPESLELSKAKPMRRATPTSLLKHIAEAEKDDKIVAVTAAMPTVRALICLARRFPDVYLMWVLPSSMR